MDGFLFKSLLITKVGLGTKLRGLGLELCGSLSIQITKYQEPGCEFKNLRALTINYGREMPSNLSLELFKPEI